MQILPRENGQFELKIRDGLVSLSQSVALNAFALLGPGEYEAGGLMAEASHAGTRITLEDLTIGHINPHTKKLSDQDIEQLGAVDILFFPLGGDGMTTKEAISLIGQVEAPLMVPQVADPEELVSFRKSVSNCEAVAGSYKISRSQLPTVGSQILIFEPGKTA